MTRQSKQTGNARFLATQMFPVALRVVQDPPSDLIVTGVFQSDASEIRAIEGHQVGPRECEQNRGMRRDDELRLARCDLRPHMREKNQLTLWRERRFRFVQEKQS